MFDIWRYFPVWWWYDLISEISISLLNMPSIIRLVKQKEKHLPPPLFVLQVLCKLIIKDHCGSFANLNSLRYPYTISLELIFKDLFLSNILCVDMLFQILCPKPSSSRKKVIHEWHSILAILFSISFFLFVWDWNMIYSNSLMRNSSNFYWNHDENYHVWIMNIILLFFERFWPPNRRFDVILFLVCVGFLAISISQSNL